MKAAQLWAWVRSGVDGEGLRIGALHAENRALWVLEDAVRDPALSAEQVTAFKRRIDGHNLARHAAVRTIDAAIDARFSPAASLETPGVVLNSESVGQMLDRLSVLALKLDAWAGDPREAGQRRRVALVLRCLDRILDALERGNAAPQSFDEAKTYSAT